MPPFEPNEYLFEKHADKGNERWEIFAWAVRDAMMKSGDFQPIDVLELERALKPLKTKKACAEDGLGSHCWPLVATCRPVGRPSPGWSHLPGL